MRRRSNTGAQKPGSKPESNLQLAVGGKKPSASLSALDTHKLYESTAKSSRPVMMHASGSDIFDMSAMFEAMPALYGPTESDDARNADLLANIDEEEVSPGFMLRGSQLGHTAAASVRNGAAVQQPVVLLSRPRYNPQSMPPTMFVDPQSVQEAIRESVSEVMRQIASVQGGVSVHGIPELVSGKAVARETSMQDAGSSSSAQEAPKEVGQAPEKAQDSAGQPAVKSPESPAKKSLQEMSKQIHRLFNGVSSTHPIEKAFMQKRSLYIGSMVKLLPREYYHSSMQEEFFPTAHYYAACFTMHMASEGKHFETGMRLHLEKRDVQTNWKLEDMHAYMLQRHPRARLFSKPKDMSTFGSEWVDIAAFVEYVARTGTDDVFKNFNGIWNSIMKFIRQPEPDIDFFQSIPFMCPKKVCRHIEFMHAEGLLDEEITPREYEANLCGGRA